MTTCCLFSVATGDSPVTNQQFLASQECSQFGYHSAVGPVESGSATRMALSPFCQRYSISNLR